jgi:beta-glucanase (GH16 family)
MIALLKTAPTRSYIEYRLKVPSQLAMWPAAWEVAGNLADWPPENDTLEMVINSGGPDVPDNSWNTFHNVKEGDVQPKTTYLSGLLDQWGSYHPHVDLSLAFHTYGTEWVQDSRGDRWRTWVDNVLVADRIYPWVTTSGGDAGGKYIFVDLAVGGSWAGRNGVPQSSFPAGFAIDYIRVFQ